MLDKYSGLVKPSEHEDISVAQENSLLRSSVQRLINNGLILEPIARNEQPRLFDQSGEIPMVNENPDRQSDLTISNDNTDQACLKITLRA